MSDEGLLALTNDIYDAAVGETPWTAVGAGLCRVFGATSASVMLGDPTRGPMSLLYHGDIPLDAVRAYQDHYRSVDLWTQRAANVMARSGAKEAPRVFVSGTLVPDAEFLRSEFYNDFGRKLGLRYVVGTVLPVGAAGHMPIGLHRPDGAAPFDATARAMLEGLLPHLRRAVQLGRQLVAQSPVGSPEAAALDAIATGFVVVDAELGVILTNAAAEALIAERSDLLRLRTRPGAGPEASTVLAASTPSAARTLATLVAATATGGGAGGAFRIESPTGRESVAVLVAPLPRRLAGRRGVLGGRVEGRALVMLRDIGFTPSAPPIEVLRSLFGLTRAEAEVVRALVGGATKETVAAERGLKLSTIRTQVRSILEKVGAASLRELEHVIGRLN